jgi:hypothetical protein
VKRSRLAVEPRDIPLLHLDISYGVRPVEVDFGGPVLQMLECLWCHTVWRIYRDRGGNWPAEWWHCPNHMRHRQGDDGRGRTSLDGALSVFRLRGFGAARSDLPSIEALDAEQLATLRRTIDARLDESRGGLFVQVQRLRSG